MKNKKIKDMKKKKECCGGFFRPTIGKIILTIIFIVIIFSLLSIIMFSFECSGKLYQIGTAPGGACYTPVQINQILTYSWIINIIISYILSCLILLIYNKSTGK